MKVKIKQITVVDGVQQDQSYWTRSGQDDPSFSFEEAKKNLDQLGEEFQNTERISSGKLKVNRSVKEEANLCTIFEIVRTVVLPNRR